VCTLPAGTQADGSRFAGVENRALQRLSSRPVLGWGCPMAGRGSLEHRAGLEAGGESVPRTIGPLPDPIYFLRPHAAQGRRRPASLPSAVCARARRSRIRPQAQCGQRAASVRKTSRRRGGPRPHGFGTGAAQHTEAEVIVHCRAANPSGRGDRKSNVGGPFFRALGRGAGGLMRLRRSQRAAAELTS
jgi:hypothetical protein